MTNVLIVNMDPILQRPDVLFCSVLMLLCRELSSLRAAQLFAVFLGMQSEGILLGLLQNTSPENDFESYEES